MNVKPLGARAIVRRIFPEQKAGAIIMPDSVGARHRWGEVVAVGDKAVHDHASATEIDGGRHDWPVQPGDRVLLPLHACEKHYADKFDHDGEELRVLEYKDLAVEGSS